MPENKATPEVKKPDAPKVPGTPPTTEQKPPAASQAPNPPTPAEKKPNDPPKEPPKAPPAPPAAPPPPPKKEPPKDAPKQPEDKGKPAAEPKKAEVPKPPADEKKPAVAENPGEKKPAEKDAAPPPKAAAPTEPKAQTGKKPEEKAPAADPKPKAPAEPKKPGEKAAPGDAAKGTSTADPKKGETAPPTPEGKGQPATDPKKPEDKTPAADPKGKPADAPKKEEAKGPIEVSGKDKVEIPIEPKGKAEDPKGAPASDPKKKDTAVEPPKGVKITQIFADRLDKPTQEDLKSLPIPQEGEGFSMRLHPAYFFEFLNHPFSVNRETDDYRELYDSIKENGINEPIKARPREGGGLELISGHRRHDVAMQLNYPVPVVIVQADNDSAQIECVDGNLHRKDIPTSELARAAKMKIEAMTRKAGRRTKMEKLTSPQKRTDQIVAEEMGYSRTQLTRLVRIDSLVPEMKQMVDSKKLPFNVAVELSYMSEPEQRDLVTVMQKEQTVPSLAQALQMKEASQKATLAAKEAAKAPKPPLQVVSTPTKPDQAPVSPAAAPGTTGKAAPTAPTVSTPTPAPAPKPPAPVDAKKFASIMKNKPEPELKVTFTGAELKDFFPDRTPTVPEVKRTVFEALEIRKKAMEKQAKKQDIKNPAR